MYIQWLNHKYSRTPSLSYPQFRNAIASKKSEKTSIDTLDCIDTLDSNDTLNLTLSYSQTNTTHSLSIRLTLPISLTPSIFLTLSLNTISFFLEVYRLTYAHGRTDIINSRAAFTGKKPNRLP